MKYPGLGEMWRMMSPPKPTLTEKNLPDQAGKVFLVTGATSGCGEELTKILYQHNAKIYMAARSEKNAVKSIDTIKTAHPNSTGELVFLHLDLSDLTTIEKSAKEFLSKESKLDVLWLNAGVMVPPQGSTTAQGWELQLGTNNIGHLLFYLYLEPILKGTASKAPADSVRVVWVSSAAAFLAPTPAVDFDNIDYKRDESAGVKYARSKAGNVLQSFQSSKRLKDSNAISVSLNPGNLQTGLQRHVPSIQRTIMKPILYEARYGALTELYAGLSTDIKIEQTGAWIQPWGRITKGRSDLEDAQLAQKYWDWCEQQVKDYHRP